MEDKNTARLRLQYDQDFINKILEGTIDSYGDNSPTEVTIESISNGRDSYRKVNEEVIAELLNLLNCNS